MITSQGRLAEDPRLARVDVIGVPITATNMFDCVGLIADNLDELRGEYICVSNVHTCVMAHDDPAYRRVQASSALSVPDGKPLSVVGRRVAPAMGRVTGPDLMRELFAASAGRGWRHYFYGNTEENLEALRAALNRDYPYLQIADMEASVFRLLSEEEEDELARRIDAACADFVWVAIGAPRQEQLCARLRGRVNGLMVGVGGAFNILAGVTPEAPQWMQDASLEWLYRLVQEPRRLLRRYLVTNTKFVIYLLTGIRPKGEEAA